MSAQPGSSTALRHSGRIPGTSRSSSARSITRTSTPGGISGQPSREICSAPRCAEEAALREIRAAAQRGNRARRRSAAPPAARRSFPARKRPSGRSRGRRTAPRPRSGRRRRGRRARAPRLAPAIPPPTMRTSYCAIARRWLRFRKPQRLGGRTMIEASFAESAARAAGAAGGRRRGDRRAHLHHLQPPEPRRRAAGAALLVVGRAALVARRRDPGRGRRSPCSRRSPAPSTSA